MRFYPSSARLNYRPFAAVSSEWVFLHLYWGPINYPGSVEARVRQGVQELMLPVWPWMLCLMLPPRGVSLINPPSSVRRCPVPPPPHRSSGRERNRKKANSFKLIQYSKLEVWLEWILIREKLLTTVVLKQHEQISSLLTKLTGYFLFYYYSSCFHGLPQRFSNFSSLIYTHNPI